MRLFGNIKERKSQPKSVQTSITSWRAAKEAIRSEKRKVDIQNAILNKKNSQNQQSKNLMETDDSDTNIFFRKKTSQALKSHNSQLKKYPVSEAQAFNPKKNQKSQLNQKIESNPKLTKKLSYNLGNEFFQQKQKMKIENIYRDESLNEKFKLKKNQNSIKLGNKQIVLLKLLGQGKFGKVFLVLQKTVGFLMAMKVIQKRNIDSSKKLQQLITQLKIQTFLNHPNIVKCYGFFQDRDRIYSFMELGSDGQLYTFMQKTLMSQESISFIIRALLQAMDYLHQNKIIHRDLKPQNIVVTHGCIKICDFGWAAHIKQGLRDTYCGTPLYFSPQMLTGVKYDEKVDVWAIGIMAFQMLTGSSPFGITKQHHLYKIVTHQVDFEEKGQIKYSKCFKSFVKNILKRNPQERLSCKQLLKEKFIAQYDQLETCQQLCKTKLKSKNRTL